ncbi:hypothetical protein EDB81DRAFT_895669, partial [Dactylonectria macrodidyma]
MKPATPPSIPQNVDLLASVLPIVAECADIFDQSPTREVDDATQATYLRLTARCHVLDSELKLVRHAIDPTHHHVVELLNELESLVESSIMDSNSHIPIQCSHPKLLVLLAQWPCVEKQVVVSELLDHKSRERNVRVDRALQKFLQTCQMRSAATLSSFEEDLPPPNRKRMEPAHVSKVIKSVFDSLMAVRKCRCHPDHQYDVRLCLATYRKPDREDSGFAFDVCLHLEQIWEESGLNPPPIRDKSTPTERDKRQGKEIKQLCMPIMQIRQRHSHRLRFALKNGRLWNRMPVERVSPLDLSGDPISLEEFMSDATLNSRLTDMTKRILAVLLGHAAHHLHGTRWMQDSWGPENVKFFRVSSTIPIKPYIQVVLEDDDVGCLNPRPDPYQEEDYFSEFFYHPFPGLVMLGIMLMQIYLTRSLRSFLEEFHFEDSGTLSNSLKFHLACRAFKEYGNVMAYSERYCSAVQKCLDPNIQRDATGKDIDEHDLRNVIYNEIIGPLEDELSLGKFPTKDLLRLDLEAQKIDLANWGQEILFRKPDQQNQDAVRTLVRLPRRQGAMIGPLSQSGSIQSHGTPSILVGKYSRPRRRVKKTPYDRLQQMWINSHKPLTLFDDKAPPSNISQQSRDDFHAWKKEVLKVYDEFINADHFISNPPTIALLDTGLDLEHPDFTSDPATRRRIRDHENFTVPLNTPERNDVRDYSGHGTHTAGILLDFAPDAELCIAKIAEYDPESARPIADAIMHAVDNWHADIISMSFGFTTRFVPHYHLVEDAIAHATSKGILLFAAASNSGANQGRTFPARHENVICMHATAADDAPSRFNPRPDDNYPLDNFATIGEAVESSWPAYMCNQLENECCLAWKSGTSYATPVAAGIAAFLLLYAVQNLDPDSVGLLRRPQGLRAVLKELSLPVQGYYYLGPRIHPDHFFGRSKEYIKQRLVEILAR